MLYLCTISQSASTLLEECSVGSSLFSRQSFTNLSRWLADARALASPQLVVVLVGSKSDREEDREVEWAEASKWAAENGGPYLEANFKLFTSLRCAFSRSIIPDW